MHIRRAPILQQLRRSNCRNIRSGCRKGLTVRNFCCLFFLRTVREFAWRTLHQCGGLGCRNTRNLYGRIRLEKPTQKRIAYGLKGCRRCLWILQWKNRKRNTSGYIRLPVKGNRQAGFTIQIPEITASREVRPRHGWPPQWRNSGDNTSPGQPGREGDNNG